MRHGRELLLALSVVVIGDAALADNAERLEHAIEAHVPAEFIGAVLVEKNHEILVSQGYGQANIEWGIPNTPATRFRIASITKQFTAAAILLLEERGQLSIDDTVGTHLSFAPAAWRDVRIFHLLTHTAGIADLSDQEEAYERFLATTPEDTLRAYEDAALESAPGEAYRYSNIGYVALGAIIESISGKRYGDFIREEIFEPLGMHDSGYEESGALIPERASGYRATADGLRHAEYLDMSRPYAAGSLYSTTQDLLRWTHALYRGELLSAESVAKMSTAFLSSYGLGVINEEVLEQEKLWHNGSIAGFSSVLAHYPGLDATLVVLSNREAPAAEIVARELEFVLLEADVILPHEHVELTLPADELLEFEGVFEYRAGLQMAFSVEGGRLYSQATDADRIPLTAYADAAFYTNIPYIRFEFRRDPNGDITGVDYFQRGRKYSLTRQ